ncbi:hypothetical protein TK1308 [Thermococcus kodakarensis KOD1]|uniref:Uncharacterized protein n=1 Tax=Thermococcus kodakarensis (strain ATCC BAA-918 / JCM 12380 / KOD1) TaxID=69014 RepID=Q5JGR6_THEKO|nr:hypothetical protein [Thermococcus kodakarensis]WCN27295.1 hypothetical protein POG15_06655 [Thermococcus kodakarensis]WCN29583.1 hypothetical protein POG21_06645 [Thermococcus kodakarensis]BAD85497.1 hypothetical protein TK1308 [Thermococcus kodakarensis KOD1]
MRQKMVWFLLGVLVGSLFVASAYPTNESVQYSIPAIQKITESNYTAYLLYSENSFPLDSDVLKSTVQTLVEESAPNAKWHVYAVPELPKSLVITGYGIKVTEEGRVDILITATRSGAPILSDKIKDELLQWSKKAPKFKPDIIPKEKIGVPEGWKVKAVDSNGNVKVYSGESSPYWHNFGALTIEVNDPPYGNIYAKFYAYGLWNDDDPSREYFLVAPDENGEGRYEIDPGYGLLEVEGNKNYKRYVADSSKIIHNWNLEPNLDPQLDRADPVGSLGGHTTTQVTVGYPPAVTFTVTIPDSKILPAVDRSTETATWLLDFNMYSEDAKYSFKTNVASEGHVNENALHDGQWHAIVNVKFQATFKYYDVGGGTYSYSGPHIEWSSTPYKHDTWGAVTWYVKVG